MLFPEIDGLGSYFTGIPKATGLNIKYYLKEVMSQIDLRYADFAGFIALIYRHGLLHQHSPKKFKYKNKEIGWQFGVSNVPTQIQRKNHLVVRNGVLKIDMNLFYNDVLNSVDKASELISLKYRNKFEISFQEQYKILTKNQILKKQRKNKSKERYIFDSDFRFLKSLK